MMDVLSLIKRHEGLRLLPYTDTTGHMTIGYGCNLEAGITEAQAAALLQLKVIDIIDELGRYAWFTGCNLARQAVLLDMAYNLGVQGLLQFHIMLECVSRGDFAGAASQMAHSEWARQVGVRAVENAKIMAEGEFPDGSSASTKS